MLLDFVLWLLGKIDDFFFWRENGGAPFHCKVCGRLGTLNDLRRQDANPPTGKVCEACGFELSQPSD